ncbi:hypothetical protein BC962_1274 [Gillisia mitskevichiae]|uniref:Secreted protein n=1 Tax=Gillisia mitskevichiae TaxID=270921 RepID=A0A495PWA8_9FLAO|nr:hypothetical protein [Gillisia mitskevichiae]RKS53029.1 hypothetical protein BC962_1274 [Gillisia mitskevichiae]
MKIYIVFLIVVISSSLGFSQEAPIKSTPIERAGTSFPPPTESSSIPARKSTNPFFKTKERTSNLPSEEKETFSMKTGNDLLTAGDFIEKKWTEDKRISEEYRKDQYLGDFKTKGSYVEVLCRDYQFVDGDKVRVYVNGKMIESVIELQANYTPILVKLDSGFNTIEIEALNQGSSGPNTAAFKIYGDQGELITTNEWNLLTGAKASVIVVKQ